MGSAQLDKRGDIVVRRFLGVLMALIAVIGLAIPAAAQQVPERPRPDRLDSLRLAQPASADAATLDPALLGASGEVAVSIVLDAPRLLMWPPPTVRRHSNGPRPSG